MEDTDLCPDIDDGVPQGDDLEPEDAGVDHGRE